MNDYLEHHGVKGMQWGVRNYQNPDGSLTAKGRQHYDVGDGSGGRNAFSARAMYNRAIARASDANANYYSKRNSRFAKQMTGMQRANASMARRDAQKAQLEANRKAQARREKMNSPEFKAKAKKAAIIGGSIVAAGLAAYGAYKLSKVRSMANSAATIRAKNFLFGTPFRTSINRGHFDGAKLFAQSRENDQMRSVYEKAVNKVASRYANEKTGSFKNALNYLRKGDMDNVPAGLRQELMAELSKSGIHGSFMNYGNDDFFDGVGGLIISEIFS